VNPELFIGMISGTSRDGVDAALVSFEQGQPKIHAALCAPYPPGLAAKLQQAVLAGQRPEDSILAELDQQLAEQFSATVHQLLKKAGIPAQEIQAIGSHGQTVWHDPDGPRPESIQLGNPQLIAQLTGIDTVGDFRRADIEAGGQGAPLAPLLHRALFLPDSGQGPACRIVVNLGGIANISVIDQAGQVSGYDTGPANCLLDAWIQEHRHEPFDRDGNWAASGRKMSSLLQEMLADPYFHKPAPKSTGVEYFNLSWLRNFKPEGSGKAPSDPADVQATLAQLTAVTVADEIRPHAPNDVLVCGGGAHNSDLCLRLQNQLPGIAVKSTADFGLDPDWVEAVLFAWLARERLAGQPLDTRNITGAENPVLLGFVAQPR
jgi:anhydro-N-acetylmuramic acid kinase